MSNQFDDLILQLKSVGFMSASKEVDHLRASLMKLDETVNETNASFAKSKTALNSANKTISQYEEKLTTAERQNKKLKDQVDQLSGKKGGAGFLGLDESIGKTIKKVLLWTASTSIIFGTFRAFKEGGRIIAEHDAQMTALRKVYSGAESDLVGIEAGILDVSRQMKSLTAAAFEAGVTVARTGRTNLEVIELTRVALIGQNIAELEAAQGVKSLNSALIQFEQEADQAIRILDEWNELSNKTPATTKDMADAVSVAGSVFEQAGASIQFLNANTAALVEITAKSGNVIGRAERTMAIYAQRQKTVNLLTQLGIDVFDEQRQEFIGIDKLLFTVAAKWDNLTDKMKTNVAQSIAGTRQQQFFIALMENQDKVMKNLETQWNSFGSAIEENEMFLESILKRVDGLRNALERLVITLGDKGATAAIKGTLDGLTALANGLNDASKLTFNLAAAVGGLAIVFLPISSTLGLIAAAILAATGALVLFNKVLGTTNRESRLAEEASRRRAEKINSENAEMKDILKTLEALQFAREKLVASGDDTSQIDEKIAGVLETLKTIYPQITTGVNGLTDAYDTLNTKIEENSQLLLQQEQQAVRQERAAIARRLNAAKAEQARVQAIIDAPSAVEAMSGSGNTVRPRALPSLAQEKAEVERLKGLRASLRGQLEGLEIPTGEPGKGGKGGGALTPFDPDEESRRKAAEAMQKRIDALKLQQELIQLQIDGATEQEIIVRRMVQLENLLNDTGRTDLENEQAKTELLQQQLRLERLIFAEAEQFGNIFERNISRAVASGFDGDEVRLAIKNLANQLGAELAEKTQKSITESLLESGTNKLFAGLIGGVGAGLISGAIGLLGQKLFGEDTDSDRQLLATEENTIQLRENTDAMRNLSSTFINAPTGFAFPSASAGNASAGTSASIGGTSTSIQSIDRSITIGKGAINVNAAPGQSAQSVSQQVMSDLTNLSDKGGGARTSL
jgi:TP901 family phage tail tape measure protein